MPTIKELVQGNTVEFKNYHKGNLWYFIPEKNFLFPVPIEDTGDGVFVRSDKAMLFMRYIRAHKEYIEAGLK